MPIGVLAKHDFKPQPFKEAAARIARKVALPSDIFNTLPVAARKRAFRIAGVQKLSLIQRARNIVRSAVEKGTSYQRVRRALEQLFLAEGVPAPAQHRLYAMWRQNTLAAYSDARRKLLDSPDISSIFTFRQYFTVGNGVPGINNVRPTHAALHGKVFAWDDPFWDFFTPPFWDWGCRCFFAALTAGQVRRLGLTVWTYRGGMVGPTDLSADPFPLRPHPDFAAGTYEEPQMDLSGFDPDLRKLAEEALAIGD